MFISWHLSKSWTILLAREIIDPECRVDQDCPSKLSCIDEGCRNPCQLINPCTGNQKCVVTDTLPTRTIACVCPDGTVFSDCGNCQKGKNWSDLYTSKTYFFHNVYCD